MAKTGQTSAPRTIDYTLLGRKLMFVDEFALEPGLRRKLADRRAAGYPPAHRGTGPGEREESTAWAGLAIAGATAAPFLIAGGLGWTWLGWLLGFGVPIVVAIVCGRLIGARNRLGLSAAERQAVAVATRYLVLPSADPPDSSALETGAEEIVGRAWVVCRRIMGSGAWASGYLDTHRTRLDPAAELDSVIQHALHLHCVARHLRSARTGARAPIDAGWRSLCDRVTALAEYSVHLDQLAAELSCADSVAAESIEADSAVVQVHLNTVADEFAAAGIRQLQEEADDVGVVIGELVATLDRDLAVVTSFASGDAGPRG
ncbi:hypothetical protein [Nocardia sp. NPDC050793]|uniref:hypothetical protein n=1 Tax=Nocardia sp. NPDC050793 TaxID=3155159 RepID=UPI0033E92C00